MEQQSIAVMTKMELSSTLNILIVRLRSAHAVCNTIDEAMPYGPILNNPKMATELVEQAQWLVSALNELLRLATADADRMETLLRRQ